MTMIVDEMYFIKDESETESTIESSSLLAAWPFTFDSEMEDLNYAEVLEAISLVDVRRRFIEALALQFGRPVEANSVGILGM
ncbi:hypothetical protein ACFX19_020364 [Malus domestica]